MSKQLFKSSIGKKIIMAASGFFLMFFLLQHLTINMMSVIAPEMFNSVSHFMGTNPMVQFLLQPILMLGVIVHFAMGLKLNMENNKARNIKYAYNKPSANSTFMSRYMIVTGIIILFFLILHFIDFWIPEMIYKYVQFKDEDPTRYLPELKHHFEEFWRVAAYCISFVLLGIHLQHGFSSAFQSVGARSNNNKNTLQKLGTIYSIVVPLGFIFIAIFHFVSH